MKICFRWPYTCRTCGSKSKTGLGCQVVIAVGQQIVTGHLLCVGDYCGQDCTLKKLGFEGSRE